MRPSSGVIAQQLGESAVLIRLQTNRIYELNETGTRIWELLGQGSTPKEIVDALQREFDEESAALSNAVNELITTLRLEGLVDAQ